MYELRKLGNEIIVSIRLDETGFMGRECPECERYFKFKPGIGFTGEQPSVPLPVLSSRRAAR